MTPTAIIESAAASGVMLAIAPSGRIEATGDQDAVSQWLSVIRENKAALIAALKVGADDTAMEPFDREAFEERAAICEFDGGLTRAAAEAIAWQEDDRRRCTQCQNRRAHDGVCRIAEPKAGALVVANRTYTPDPILPRRCEGYAPKTSDPDQRAGADRWPGLREVA